MFKKVIVLFTFLPCLQCSSALANDEHYLKVVEDFQAYCFSTQADFKQIENLIVPLKLRPLPEEYARALAGADSKITKLYLVEKIDDDKAILLGFSQPNACSINVQGIEFMPIKKMMIEHFKLARGHIDDVGLQVNELHVPGGISGNKKEAASKGIIMLMYPKPAMGYLGGTISYLPPEQAKNLFK